MDIKQAKAILIENSYKLTKRRKDILTFFNAADGYRTAKELHEYMEENYEGISFDTVYRNLHLFHQLNILETTYLNSEKNFRMSCAQHHHHHFICNDCGKTKKINVCPMNDIDQHLKEYMVLDHKFEIYGLCPICQSA
ncbi:MAG TPA: Fur family transcriptional regulator [Bacillota bacterium]|nr:Fur family transcriptional regulator [Bacillota bacterium]